MARLALAARGRVTFDKGVAVCAPQSLDKLDVVMSKFVNVFFDGTENTEAKSAKEKTHIRRVFEYIANTFGDGASLEVHRNIACRLSHGLPDGNIRTSIYIEGIRGPLKSIAGLGLLRRVAIAAYLISKNEQPGDVITIFGFSRGGAEALLLAHFIGIAVRLRHSWRRYKAEGED